MDIAATRIGLPVMVEREVYKGIVVPVPSGDTVYKNPGDRITKAELEGLGWPADKIEEDMAELRKHGSVVDQAEWDKILHQAEADSSESAAPEEAQA